MRTARYRSHFLIVKRNKIIEMNFLGSDSLDNTFQFHYKLKILIDKLLKQFYCSYADNHNN